MPFPDLGDRLSRVRGRIAAAVEKGGRKQTVTIVAVTKSHGPDAVRAAWDAGLRDVGENRVQEALGKIQRSDVAVRWHLIGHLQRNKVKHAGHFHLIHSLDSARLADALHREGDELGRPVDVLVQVNVVGEQTKGGFSADEVRTEAQRLKSLPGIRIRGVMTMAPLGASEAVLRRVFGGARAIRDLLAEAGHPATELSMGMSDDFEIAVEEGATFVRLGTVLFGERAT